MPSKPIDRGCSILNAADVTANPHGLILSEKEREVIYGGLTTLDNITNALLYGRRDWKQQLEAAFSAGVELVGVGVAVVILHRVLDVPAVSALIVGIALVILQKVNLLLTHEKIEDTHTRRQREEETEGKERAKYFKDMGCKDMSG